jgi:hypothetical protein
MRMQSERHELMAATTTAMDWSNGAICSDKTNLQVGLVQDPANVCDGTRGPAEQQGGTVRKCVSDPVSMQAARCPGGESVRGSASGQ